MASICTLRAATLPLAASNASDAFLTSFSRLANSVTFAVVDCSSLTALLTDDLIAARTEFRSPASPEKAMVNVL